MTEFEVSQRAYALAEKSRRAVRARQWTDKPGGAWVLNEFDTPTFFGAYGKACMYASYETGDTFEVHVFSYSTGARLAFKSFKGLAPAFRWGEVKADDPAVGSAPSAR